MSTRPEQGRNPIKARGAPTKSALLVFCAAATLLGATLWTNDAAAASDADGLYLGWMDRSVEPGADFFRFANGGWLKANRIPRDRSYWGVDSVLEQENQAFIRDLVESLGRQDWAANTAQRKVADFYLSGMDEKAIDAAGAKPLEPELARIAAIRTPADIAEEIAHLQTIGVAAPLSLGQMQDFNDSTRVIAVGPEGGWDDAERTSVNCTVGLGPTVLRAETAAVVAGALLCALRCSVVLPLA